TELLAVERRARAAERGMWGERAYRPLTARAAARVAIEANANCTRGDAPFRIVEGRIAEAQVFDRRASLRVEGAVDPPFSVVLFGESFGAWDGPDLETLNGAKVRVRGPLGVFHDEPQLCIDHSSQMEVVTD
ncbi:MAG: hypothetical protein ABL932_07700, partial [Terricaulis sp.]